MEIIIVQVIEDNMPKDVVVFEITEMLPDGSDKEEMFAKAEKAFVKMAKDNGFSEDEAVEALEDGYMGEGVGTTITINSYYTEWK